MRKSKKISKKKSKKKFSKGSRKFTVRFHKKLWNALVNRSNQGRTPISVIIQDTLMKALKLKKLNRKHTTI